ncbi:RND efflux system, membrane fusion protein (MFP) [Desulfosarcina variabilis str. Montpellier]|uniref:efflux RND transporter periplasmic adaptor subunit n=1 Tax=Desulfosarcina variabilis TaxID=2300 RepID=UPI003AFA8010
MTETKTKASFFIKVGKFLIPLLLLVAGGAAYSYFKATAPVMRRATPQRQVTAVDVQTVQKQDVRTVVSAMGSVVAARQVTLKAQVAGTIMSVSSRFIPGGLIPQGAELLSIDPSDYEVAVQKARSALSDAKASLAIEQGSQTIAREELRLISDLSTDGVAQTDLALRKPQLQQAQAAVTSAEADLRQAMLDLNRTVVKAPFNAMIITRDVNVGTSVGAQESLVALVGTDEYWIEAVVSLDQLSLIDMDHPGGCPALVRSQAGQGQWQGRVIQIAGKLNATSHMATVIIAIKDPLGAGANLAAGRLMIDDYVNVDITGRQLEGVIELPRSVLQDGNTVWVNTHNTLDIRPVSLAWKSVDKVYLKSGVQPGEAVVMSALSTPVQGMALKIAGADVHEPKSNMAGKGDIQ